jgi:hypothetical protein
VKPLLLTYSAPLRIIPGEAFSCVGLLFFQWKRSQYCGYFNQISEISGSRLCVSVGIHVLIIATDKWPVGNTAVCMTLSGCCFKQAVLCLMQFNCPF